MKAVVAGDGADEIFLGSEVFKEASVRRFCLRQPESRIRPLLFERLSVSGSSSSLDELAIQRLLGAAEVGDPLFSHLPSFEASRIDDLYAPDFKTELGGQDVIGELRASLPTRFFGWSVLNRAAYLQMTIGLSAHVLDSCLDRMMMAHGVEGRYPFLDHRVFEFAAALPTSSRLCGLRGTEVLARWASRILPRQIRPERERPAASSDVEGFLAKSAPAWVDDRLSPSAISRTGIFSESSVGSLLRRCRASDAPNAADSQAFVGVLSTQLWHEQFVENSMFIAPLSVSGASVLLSDGAALVPTSNLSDAEPS
jgi:asparagine synthase (glutamine-hydrolysing)